MPPQTPSLHTFWINETLDRVPEIEEDESVFADQTLEELLAADFGGMDLGGAECVAERETPASTCDARDGEVVECGGDSNGVATAWLGAGEVSVDAARDGGDDRPVGEVLDDMPAMCTHQLREGGGCRNAHERRVVSDTPSAPAPDPTTPPLVPPSSLPPATREAPAHRARPIWAAMHTLLSKSTRYGPTHPALLSERFACHRVQTAPQTSGWASTMALLRREVKLKKNIGLMVAEAGEGRRCDDVPERLREGRECVREGGGGGDGVGM